MRYNVCQAKFWRPTGLGNRLFSWARAKVFYKETGIKMLAPTWGHIRGASIIRGGVNYNNALRKILLYDNFKSCTEEIKGVSKLLIKKRNSIITVKTLPEGFHILKQYSSQSIISFAGNTQHDFADLWQFRGLISVELKKITKRKWLKFLEEFDYPFIGINIRMGNDFKSARAEDFKNSSEGYLKTPLHWYVESLRYIRHVLGKDLPAILISDGNIKDLNCILEEPLVHMPNSKSAISDLLILSKSSVLIGSGRSSFSAWASFLGEMPTVTIPGSNLQSFKVSENTAKHFVGELDPNAPSTDFANAISFIK